ncbi:long-chain fatty acid--CoA ligase [Nocardioides zeae]|uniref:Long-chain fatty acid--CoA ligase n=1 Tax=Nocardioides imazamoxiresistens TaxID=3231893 RepID=A0ABU3PR13_9ACTN|nr:long-chain fatty acid--CoA ligase [Nocardioides zeae]MDT9591670.1 long-chain fatty acid--CoA ligase [Nocardioides zeae]
MTTLTRTEEPFEALPRPGTLLDAFERTVGLRPDRTAVRSHDGRLAYTWAELADRVAAATAGFVAAGVTRGDKVALLVRNRPEFYVVDLALVRIGAVPFSLYASSSPEQHAYALADSGAVGIVVDPALQRGLEGVDLPVLRVQIEGEPAPGWRSLADVVDAGAGTAIDALPRPEPDDVATMIYTSGTTGAPKGVLLSHQNLLTCAEATLTTQGIAAGTVTISWLPSAHVGDRLGGYALPLYQGLEVVTLDDPRQVVAAVVDVRPGYFYGPPRIFEKLRASFDSWVLGLEPDRAEEVRAALRRGQERVEVEQAGGTPSPELREATQHDRTGVFRPWLESVGLDRLRTCVVATAPNPGPLMSFFHVLGVPMGEAYGSTESSGGGTAATPGAIRIGTVGTVSTHMELRLLDDGEVLLRGPQIMKGYHGRPEATAAAVDADGWLHTGDLGSLDADGHLSIVGRKKEIIISSSGKNISPVTVESAVLSASPFIGQMCCVGDGRPYTVALVVLDAEYARGWARQQGRGELSLEELSRDPEVLAQVEAGVAAGNARLNRPEQVKRFRVVPGEWLPGAELTPTSKMRRSVILDKYADLIEEMYA